MAGVTPIRLGPRLGRGYLHQNSPFHPRERTGKGCGIVAGARRWPLIPSERNFITILTRCCAKNAEFATACVA